MYYIFRFFITEQKLFGSERKKTYYLRIRKDKNNRYVF